MSLGTDQTTISLKNQWKSSIDIAKKFYEYREVYDAGGKIRVMFKFFDYYCLVLDSESARVMLTRHLYSDIKYDTDEQLSDALNNIHLRYLSKEYR